MTRNQQLQNVVKRLLNNVMFTVDSGGNITPQAKQYVSAAGSIVTQLKTGATFGGQVCARQSGACQCSTLVGVSSGSHMAVGQGYAISSSVSYGSEFEIYALTSSGGTIANTTNGTIHIGD